MPTRFPVASGFRFNPSIPDLSRRLATYTLRPNVDNAPPINRILKGGNVNLTIQGIGPGGSSLICESQTTINFFNSQYWVSAHANDTIIRNKNLAGSDSNIAIIGTGNALIDGRTQNQDGENAVLWKNNALLFVNVTGLTLNGFTLQDYNGWGISPQNCTRVLVSNIVSAVNNVTFNQALVNTADGGTDHRYLNLSGETADDFLALVSRPGAGFSYAAYVSPGGNTNTALPLSQVVVHNIAGICGNHRMLRLLCGDGGQIFHVNASKIENYGHQNAHVVELLGQIYPTVPPSPSDFLDITCSDVKGGGGVSMCHIQSNCSNVRFNNVTASQSWTTIAGVETGCIVNDLRINDVHVPVGPLPSVGTYFYNYGTLNTCSIDGSSGKQAFKSLLDGTGGTFTNFAMRNFNHPACTDKTVVNYGTQSFGPDLDVLMGGATYKRYSGITLRTQRVTYTAADQTLNSTSWTSVASGGAATFDITLPGVYIDSWIEVGFNVTFGTQAVVGTLDVATMVSGSPVNLVATGAAPNNTKLGFVGNASAVSAPVNGTLLYKLQAADIVPLVAGDQMGTVLLRPYYRTTTAANLTLNGLTPPFTFWARVAP